MNLKSVNHNGVTIKTTPLSYEELGIRRAGIERSDAEMKQLASLIWGHRTVASCESSSVEIVSIIISGTLVVNLEKLCELKPPSSDFEDLLNLTGDLYFETDICQMSAKALADVKIAYVFVTDEDNGSEKSKISRCTKEELKNIMSRNNPDIVLLNPITFKCLGEMMFPVFDITSEDLRIHVCDETPAHDAYIYLISATGKRA